MKRGAPLPIMEDGAEFAAMLLRVLTIVDVHTREAVAI